MNPWLLLAGGAAAMALVMAILWLVQRRTGNAGIVDVGWTWGTALLALVFVAWSDGLPARRLLAALLPALWGVRLGGHLLVRLLSHPEDPRYTSLKADWGAEAQSRMFRFYQAQGLAAVLFALPSLLAARNPAPLGGTDWAAVVVWIIALTGETVADWQLSTFRKLASTQGQVCRVGLWRYSRHPNYFFEWLNWWAYALLATTAPWGFLAWLAPLAMLYFFLYVTGIPLAEQQSLRSRGEAYREYQRTTSPFVPWPPRA